MITTNRVNPHLIPGNDYVTSVISVVVKPTMMVAYERWLEKINHQASKASVFLVLMLSSPRIIQNQNMW